ncbi:RICIN domain-containing protein [Saccharopolyspora phatthalungensis]|uniref:Ricin B lectin domain-containing protein n=1 Tax=Saccharopolyspora phatthalungensis TaxID=664693 RepID=A0A840QEW2_9PSEU|nr:RICIN domain-containing protein [Saccharopolyspora phatthalungensis]MBB5159354.1 hypothetical protein [Saccharopolyspora phatthalungensis]
MTRSALGRVVAALIAMAFVVGGGFVASSAGATAGQPTKAESALAGFLIVSRMNGLCLEVRGDNVGDGGAVAMLGCTGRNNQRWSRSGSQYRNDHSGKCLDLNSNNGATGAGLNQWTCGDIPAQRWTFTGSEFRNQNNKCLTVPAGNRWDGAAVVMWDCVGAADQQWQIG